MKSKLFVAILCLQFSFADAAPNSGTAHVTIRKGDLKQGVAHFSKLVIDRKVELNICESPNFKDCKATLIRFDNPSTNLEVVIDPSYVAKINIVNPDDAKNGEKTLVFEARVFKWPHGVKSAFSKQTCDQILTSRSFQADDLGSYCENFVVDDSSSSSGQSMYSVHVSYTTN